MRQAPKIKTMGKSKAKKIRLLETNDPAMLGNLAGEFGSEGMLYGSSHYQRAITREGIAKERLLRQGRKIPK